MQIKGIALVRIISDVPDVGTVGSDVGWRHAVAVPPAFTGTLW